MEFLTLIYLNLFVYKSDFNHLLNVLMKGFMEEINNLVNMGFINIIFHFKIYIIFLTS